MVMKIGKAKLRMIVAKTIDHPKLTRIYRPLVWVDLLIAR